MKKTVETTRVVKRDEYYCDVCGNKISSYDLKFCDVCEKHLCKGCAIRSDDAFNGYSPSFYCRMCWNIGDIYRGEIADERAKRDRNIMILECKWRKAGREGLL